MKVIWTKEKIDNFLSGKHTSTAADTGKVSEPKTGSGRSRRLAKLTKRI